MIFLLHFPATNISLDISVCGLASVFTLSVSRLLCARFGPYLQYEETDLTTKKLTTGEA